MLPESLLVRELATDHYLCKVDELIQLSSSISNKFLNLIIESHDIKMDGSLLFF